MGTFVYKVNEGDVGDYIKLIWDGTDWLIVQNSGVVAA